MKKGVHLTPKQGPVMLQYLPDLVTERLVISQSGTPIQLQRTNRGLDGSVQRDIDPLEELLPPVPQPLLWNLPLRQALHESGSHSHQESTFIQRQLRVEVVLRVPVDRQVAFPVYLTAQAHQLSSLTRPTLPTTNHRV